MQVRRAQSESVGGSEPGMDAAWQLQAMPARVGKRVPLCLRKEFTSHHHPLLLIMGYNKFNGYFHPANLVVVVRIVNVS